MRIRSAIALCVLAVSAGGCATKSDIADLQATFVGQFESERSQREALISEIQVLRAVLLDSLNVQQRRDITGRVDLQRQIQDLNTNLAQLIELTGQTQRELALRSVAITDAPPKIVFPGTIATLPSILMFAPILKAFSLTSGESLCISGSSQPSPKSLS